MKAPIVTGQCAEVLTLIQGFSAHFARARAFASGSGLMLIQEWPRPGFIVETEGGDAD